MDSLPYSVSALFIHPSFISVILIIILYSFLLV